MAKPIPIETFIRARRKEGLTSDQIIAKLHEAGYNDVVGVLADHERHYQVGAAILLCALLIMSVWTFALYQQPAVLSPSRIMAQQALVSTNPSLCISVPLSDREKCLQGVLKNIPTTNPTPNQVAAQAALTKDDSPCNQFTGDNKAQCLSSAAYTRARLEGNKDLCSSIPNPIQQNSCFMEVLGATNPQQLNALMAQMNNAVQKGINDQSPQICATLAYTFLQQQCTSMVSLRVAVATKDSSLCADIPDPLAQDYCKQVARQGEVVPSAQLAQGP